MIYVAQFLSLIDNCASEETANLIRCVLLHRFRNMPVCVEGESGAVMTQQTGERFHIHTVLECKRSECVPLWHNKDKSENPVFSRADGLSLFFFHKIRPPKWRSGKEGEKAGLHIKDKFLG